MLSLTSITRQYRNIRRYRQIINVLLKYGFGDIIHRLHLEHYLQLGMKIIRWEKSKQDIVNLTTAERLRFVLQELGPTFVKFGQVMSIRPDLISPDFIKEFQKLQDDVAPFSFEEAKRQIEEDLGSPLEELFSKFEITPIAAASIAQVHTAILEDGSEVVVKIRRPDIIKTIKADIDILLNLAHLVKKYIPESELYDPVGIIKEFSKTIHREIDFTLEGHSVDRFKANFKDDETVYVPTVYWHLTSQRILTLEQIKGIKVSELDKLEKAGLDRKIIANNGVNAILKQILIHGFFHADPHPGNILILDNNIIAFVDYGMVGRIDSEMANNLADIFIAIIKKNSDEVVSTLSKISVIDEEINTAELKLDITDFIDRYYDIPLEHLEIGKITRELLEINIRHRMKVSPNFLLLAKSLITIEEVGRQLNPQFDMAGHMEPFVEKLLKRKLEPVYFMRKWGEALREFNELMRILPKEIEQILRKIKKGHLKIEFEHKGLENWIPTLDKISNRLAFSLIIGALIVGSSIIIQANKGPLIMDFSILGILGYGVAGFLGLWLVIAILRSGRL